MNTNLMSQPRACFSVVQIFISLLFRSKITSSLNPMSYKNNSTRLATQLMHHVKVILIGEVLVAISCRYHDINWATEGGRFIEKIITVITKRTSSHISDFI